MDINKIIKNKYSNWEVTPRRKNANADALKSAEKPTISFSDVKKKYRTVEAQDNMSDNQEKVGIDKKWKPTFIAPRDKTADNLMEGKLRSFDEESGEQVASQG